jgi:hypothetical protein
MTNRSTAIIGQPIDQFKLTNRLIVPSKTSWLVDEDFQNFDLLVFKTTNPQNKTYVFQQIHNPNIKSVNFSSTNTIQLSSG